MAEHFDAAVIGGGFYGCGIARHLAGRLRRVVLLEERPDLLLRASYANQARVHNGYHYPRSWVTALRSRVNCPRFLDEFADCIDRGFRKYYAVARRLSKVTAGYFERFCRRVGAAIAPAPPEVCRLFRPDLVEAVFEVEEYAFDAVKLRRRMRLALDGAGVDVRLGARVARVGPRADGRLALECETAGGREALVAGHVFNCTYAQLNRLLAASGLPALALKHELTEMALVEVPAALRQRGVTVMCGPFFSCMPFPALGLHTLSHVRYTPHGAWHEGPGRRRDGQEALCLHARRSNFAHMVRDAQRYLPALGECRHVDSLWEVKTVLPASEADDGRPILFQRDAGLANLHCVLGAKIDNLYDVLEEIDVLLASRRAA